jgi:hypothetical protein
LYDGATAAASTFQNAEAGIRGRTIAVTTTGTWVPFTASLSTDPGCSANRAAVAVVTAMCNVRPRSLGGGNVPATSVALVFSESR